MNEIMTILQRGSVLRFALQTGTILELFLFGWVFLHLLREKTDSKWELLLSYPVGLSFYALCGYGLLLIGVPFTGISVTGLMILVLLGIWAYKKRKNNAPEPVEPKVILTACAVTLVLAAVCTSGLLPVSVSNDSVYYYSTYPAILTSEKFYVSSLDSFLSNVGQTTAIVNCLPFLFGFDETFGIQWFLNLNFIAIFFEACRETAIRKNVTLKIAAGAAGAAALFLATSEPFLGTAVWILSNAYFMEYFFIAFYLAVKISEESIDSADFLVTEALFVGMISMLRMEGGVIMTVLTVLISVYPASKKRLLLVYCLPLFLTVAGYYIMFFGRMGIDPLYSFLDWKKAALMIVMALGLVIYVVFIRPLIPRDYIPTLLVLLLTAGNAGILVISRERYLTDIRAFILNVRQGNGWGYFGIAVGILIILIAVDFIRNRFKLSCVGAVLPVMILSIIAVCWARGGVLAVRMSDSGNRVMMQIAPLVVYVLFCYIISTLRQDR